jgi:hypothetical protein
MGWRSPIRRGSPSRDDLHVPLGHRGASEVDVDLVFGVGDADNGP